jgi:hypothetical protein
MDRLAQALVGDWDTVEMMEPGPFFPEGGSRKGNVHVRLAVGGYILIYEVHSDGSAGKLDGFLTIWWEKNTKLYYFLACFNNPNGPCRIRGTAHWEGNSFVNDYEETVKGKGHHGETHLPLHPLLTLWWQQWKQMAARCEH